MGTGMIRMDEVTRTLIYPYHRFTKYCGSKVRIALRIQKAKLLFLQVSQLETDTIVCEGELKISRRFVANIS